METLDQLRALAVKAGVPLVVTIPAHEGYPNITRNASKTDLFDTSAKIKALKALSESDEAQKIRDLCGDDILFREPDPDILAEVRKSVIISSGTSNPE